MEEQAFCGQFTSGVTHGKIDPDRMRPLTTLNLTEVLRELEELERRLTPLLNQVRIMQGKRPVIVPKG